MCTKTCVLLINTSKPLIDPHANHRQTHTIHMKRTGFFRILFTSLSFSLVVSFCADVRVRLYFSVLYRHLVMNMRPFDRVCDRKWSWTSCVLLLTSTKKSNRTSSLKILVWQCRIQVARAQNAVHFDFDQNRFSFGTNKVQNFAATGDVQIACICIDCVKINFTSLREISTHAELRSKWRWRNWKKKYRFWAGQIISIERNAINWLLDCSLVLLFTSFSFSLFLVHYSQTAPRGRHIIHSEWTLNGRRVNNFPNAWKIIDESFSFAIDLNSKNI